MITLESYFMGRDTKYASECDGKIRKNALKTVSRVNSLLTIYAEFSRVILTKVSSGWRPSCINDVTSNAAKLSTHLTADGCDIEDLDRAFAAWCVLHPETLAECGLYLEDPRWTPSWCHLQTRPPGSGKRIYIPSTKPPKAPALLGQKPLPMSIKL